MTTRTQRIVKPKLLIGEGLEEVRFFSALLAHLSISDVQVEEYGGKRQLSRYFQELQIRPGYQEIVSIGITRDADNSAPSAFQKRL